MRITVLIFLLSIQSVAAFATPAILPVPERIQDGDIVLLDCGHIYSGELDLANKSRVTVRTAVSTRVSATVSTNGDCGPAAITPARPVHGWVRDIHNSSIWSAALDFIPAGMKSSAADQMLLLCISLTQPWTGRAGVIAAGPQSPFVLTVALTLVLTAVLTVTRDLLARSSSPL